MLEEFRFERLHVWHKAMAVVKGVYQVSGAFPDSEKFGLISQARRAAISVASNIAESTGKSSDADVRRIIEIAYGSLMELVCQLRLAEDLGYLDAAVHDQFRADCAEIARMLSGLRKSRSRTS